MVVQIRNATIQPLWQNLNLDIQAGEFIAVLGPNGVGKSTLLSAILGTRRLDSGKITTTDRIGYIPQQRMFPHELPLRARDLVSLSLAHGTFSRRTPPAEAVTALLEEVGATYIGDRRVGLLSGGQQQLVRQAQALAQNPQVLLCDEPLLSLDMAMQQHTTHLLERRKTEHNTAIVFVTHSINPILHLTDRVLYLAPHGHTIGTVDEVMTSQTLSELYGAHVDVVRVGEKLVVV